MLGGGILASSPCRKPPLIPFWPIGVNGCWLRIALIMRIDGGGVGVSFRKCGMVPKEFTIIMEVIHDILRCISFSIGSEPCQKWE